MDIAVLRELVDRANSEIVDGGRLPLGWWLNYESGMTEASGIR